MGEKEDSLSDIDGVRNMAGPVRESPSELARQEKDLNITPGPILPPGAVSSAPQPISLVEKFAAQMGGVEPKKMLSTLKATAFRLPDKNYGGSWEKQEVTNEQMMALLVVANKYNLNPFIKEIYAFPDKGGIVPIVGVDGWSRMINDHDQFDGMKFEFTEEAEEYNHAKRCPIACTCIIYRKDRSHPTEVTEYLDEVYREPFVKNGQVKSGPWQSHTKRMLRHKSMIQCARIAFGFTGIHDDDEAERIVVGEYIQANDAPTQAQSLTSRFKSPAGGPDTPPEAKGDIVEGEFEAADTKPEPPPAGEGPEPERGDPEPEKKIEDKPPATKPKAKPRATKPPPVNDPTQKFMDRIIGASTEEGITDILTEIAGVKGISQAKRMVLKRAAQAKMKDLLGPVDDG